MTSARALYVGEVVETVTSAQYWPPLGAPTLVVTTASTSGEAADIGAQKLHVAGLVARTYSLLPDPRAPQSPVPPSKEIVDALLTLVGAAASQ